MPDVPAKAEILPRVDPSALDPVRLRARDRDRRGHAAHGWLAALAGVLVTGPTSFAEFALAPVLVLYVLRSWVLGDAFFAVFRRSMVVAVLAFGVWLCAGVAWTDAPVRTAFEEPANLRWCLALGLLWPVLDRREHVIRGMMIGFALGQASQLWQGLGFALGFETPFDRLPVRFSGYWDPAVAGGVLTVALGLHLPTALMGRGPARWVSVGLALAAAAGLGATGSRGGWVATALLVLVALVVAVRTGRGRGAALVVLAAGVVGAVAVATAPPIRDRVGVAVQEVRAALTEGDYSGDTGARIGMARYAGEAFLSSPIVGVGTAGYSHWARDNGAGDEVRLADHAHNTWAHLAGCNGVIGVGLFGWVLCLGVSGSARWARGGLGSARAGPLFAMIGLVFFSLFDTLHVSQQSAALLGVLLALSMGGPRSVAVDRSEADG